MSKRQTFYITTPIYYVNDVPHIGHAYTTVAADVLARYHRLLGEQTFFLTGTDEHGQKVQQAAAKLGVPPQQHADEMVVRFQSLWKKLTISNDHFIRTTDPGHKSIVQLVLQQLWDRQLIYEDMYQGWYCLPDERFWTEEELREGKCPDCGRPVDRISEKNYFFRMGQFHDKLKQHLVKHPEFIRPESRRNEVLGFLAKPLADLCISRPKTRLAWGIPLPFDPDYVTYVWVDALVNYISAIGYNKETERFGKFWPANFHLVGKDILTTHAVYWSTILLGLDLALPKSIFAHGWWTVDGEKMSKSKGNVVDPNSLVGEFGADAFRYFLLREVPFGQDGNFSREAFIQRVNGNLANDLGNLVNRVVGLVEQLSNGVIPKPSQDKSHPEDDDVRTIAAGLFDSIHDTLGRMEFHHALAEIWKLVDRVNRYIEETAPWSLAKKPEGKKRLETVLNTAAEALRFVAFYLKPFMPDSAEKIMTALGLDPIPTDALRSHPDWGGSLASKRVRKGPALFPRIETEAKRVSESGKTPQKESGIPVEAGQGMQKETAPGIDIKDFAKVDLRVAKILSAERVAGSNKLLKLKVDLGTEKRQVVAGIGTKYGPEELVGKTVIVVANLKPAKIFGIESQGMILAAGDKEVRALATLLEEVPPGSKIK